MENAMKNRRLLLVVAFLVSLGVGSAAAGNIKVIANSNVKAAAVSVGELKSIFLEERRSFSDGTHVEPVLEKGGPAHETFLVEYLGQSNEELQNYYRSLVFTGRGSMPKALGSDPEVVAYIARTKGAVGYVSAETNTEGVKTLSIMRAEKGAERTLIAHVEPDYPETLQQRGLGWTVRLQVTISAKGNVESVSLLGGNPVLAERVTEAVQQWKYAAARSSTTMEISIPFAPHH
jgi:TonB family protein